jgi:GGDEF domain-containing protein
MSGAMGAPGGIERRALRGLALVPQPLPSKSIKSAIDDAVTVRLVQDVFVDCNNHRQLINLLDRQVALSQQVKRPLSFVLCSLYDVKPLAMTKPSSNPHVYDEPALNVVGKIFRSHLRPTDLLIKPRERTLGIILLDAEDVGAIVVCKRLINATARQLFFGKGAVEVTLKFGISNQLDGFGGAGTSLLNTAERALEKAIKTENSPYCIAEPITGPQKSFGFNLDHGSFGEVGF